MPNHQDDHNSFEPNGCIVGLLWLVAIEFFIYGIIGIATASLTNPPIDDFIQVVGVWDTPR